MTRKFKEPGDQIIGVIPDTDTRLMNWHEYEVEVGSARGPYFLNEIESRRTLNKSNIIIVTGAPGEGKTYLAIKLGEILDTKFDPVEQIVFEREHFLRLVGNNSPLKRGQVIIVDESQYAMGSRRWYEEIQKDIMESIESVRSRGYIIIIVALHLNLLDVIIRKYVLSYMIHLEERGLGIIYRLYTPRFESNMRKYRLGKIRISLPDAEKCNYSDCLECKYRGECMTSRAVYERGKREFVGRRSKLAEERAVENKKIPGYPELIDKMIKVKDKLEYSQKDFPEIESIRMVFEEEYNIQLSFHQASTLRKRAILLKPTIFKRKTNKK